MNELWRNQQNRVPYFPHSFSVFIICASKVESNSLKPKGQLCFYCSFPRCQQPAEMPHRTIIQRFYHLFYHQNLSFTSRPLWFILLINLVKAFMVYLGLIRYHCQKRSLSLGIYWLSPANEPCESLWTCRK